MKAKIGLIHTVLSLGNMFEELLSDSISNVDLFHIVDESLLQDLLDQGELTSSIKRRLCMQVSMAAEAGADFVMVTCSSTSPAVDVARELVDIPVMKIDEPMAEKAVKTGSEIGVVATVRSTLEPSTELVKTKAAQMGEEIAVEPRLIEEAFQALRAGDDEKHDKLVTENALELSETNDVVILAQASMSHLASDIRNQTETPILISPNLAVEAISGWVDKRG